MKERAYAHLGVLAGAFLLLGLARIPAFLLAVPGFLLLFLPPPGERWGAGEFLSYAAGGSLAFWVVSFWFLSWLGLSLSAFAVVVFVLALAVVLLAYRAGWEMSLPSWDLKEALVCLALLSVLGLRVIPLMVQQLAPGGGDMSMHAYIARLIVEHNGVPSSYEPLFPFRPFADYAPGFHTLVALWSLLGGWPIHRAALLGAGLTHAMVTFALYAFLRRSFSAGPALGAALFASLVPKVPQQVIGPGWNHFVLALAFAFWSLALLPPFSSQLRWPWMVLVAPLMLAAVPLTHVTAAMGFFYSYLGAGALMLAVAAWRGRPWRGSVLELLWVGGITLALLAPYLVLIDVELSSSSLRWAETWQRDTPHAWRGSLSDALWSLPYYLQRILGRHAMWVGLAGLLASCLAAARVLGFGLAFLGVILGLIVNSHYWVLPASYVLYPNRMAIFALVPLALWTGGLLALPGRLKARRVAWIAGLALILFLLHYTKVAYKAYGTYLEISTAIAPITASDLRAFRWIESHTDLGSVFLINTSDAGLWIPALAYRPVFQVHTAPPFFDQKSRWQRKVKPDYIYVGARYIEGRPKPYDVEKLRREGDSFSLVYKGGGVHIFKIRRWE